MVPEGQGELHKHGLASLDEGLLHVQEGFLDVLGFAAMGKEVFLGRLDRGRVPAFSANQPVLAIIRTYCC